MCHSHCRGGCHLVVILSSHHPISISVSSRMSVLNTEHVFAFGIQRAGVLEATGDSVDCAHARYEGRVTDPVSAEPKGVAVSKE